MVAAIGSAQDRPPGSAGNPERRIAFGKCDRVEIVGQWPSTGIVPRHPAIVRNNDEIFCSDGCCICSSEERNGKDRIFDRLYRTVPVSSAVSRINDRTERPDGTEP